GGGGSSTGVRSTVTCTWMGAARPAAGAEPARPAFGGLGSVTPREEPAQQPAAAEPEPAPATELPATPVAPPQVPPARYDSQAEELDVPDFLK
ncbi:cell division protein FtsZ, partial [Streptomyces albidoflavus]